MISPVLFIVIVIFAISFAVYVNHIEKVKKEYVIEEYSILDKYFQLYYKESKMRAYAKSSVYICSYTNYCYNKTTDKSDLESCVIEKMKKINESWDWNIDIYGLQPKMSIDFPQVKIIERNINISFNSFNTRFDLNENLVRFC